MNTLSSKILILICFLSAATVWAGWGQPSTAIKITPSKSNPSVTCSADGKIIYRVINEAGGGTFGNIRLYKSIDGGETWAEQSFAR